MIQTHAHDTAIEDPLRPNWSHFRKTQEMKIEHSDTLEKQNNALICMVSHELKTPVTSLKAYLQALEKRTKPRVGAEEEKYFTKIHAQIDKLAHLIEQLVDKTRVENENLPLCKKPFIFEDLVDEIIEQNENATHTVEKTTDTLSVVCADRERIGQVLTNLISNAVKYSPQADRVLVAITVGTHEIQCSVTDFGIGISRDEQPYVFDRFFRLTRKSQDTFPGMGIGLYISSQIIKRHGGRMWVDSEFGKGSVFGFSLPI